MKRGYIKLWRKSLDKGLLRNHKLWAFWSWCLLRASHKDHTVTVGYQEVQLSPGQLIFGRRKAGEELGMSEREIRTGLASLKYMEKVTIKSTNKYSIITVINWPTYQGCDDTERPSKRKISGQQPTTNKNSTEQREIYKCIFDHWNDQRIIVHRMLSEKDIRALNGAFKDFTQDSILKAITNYSSVLESPDHYFKHKWTLCDFIQRGLSKFVDAADPSSNYRNSSSKKWDQSIDEHTIISHEEIEEMYR